MILSKRLKRIAESIEGYDTIADIGTDHAYLPIYLVKMKKIKRAIASDINDGPVKIAKNRTKQYRVADYIEVRKGNGLDILLPGEADVIIIAGMGGILISDILEHGLEVVRSAEFFVLQPMRDSERVRKWLLKNSFEIFDEDLIKDDGKIYEIIWARFSKVAQLSDVGENNDLMLIGEHVIKRKHLLVLEVVDKKIKELEKILESLSDKSSVNSTERADECNKLLSYYREVRQWVL